jgi:hypothetical protein
MGLLDDAIREHLDLKRARGSDPAEIERMEREALGPVRRDPTIGSARFEAAEEHASLAPEGGYPDDRDQLLDAGYHDSTAPHPQAHLQHEHEDPFLAHGQDHPFGSVHEEPEQPKRRFLRRNRPASPPDSGAPEPGFHEDHAVDPHGLLSQHDPLAQHEPLEHQEPLEHHEALGNHEPGAQHEPVGQHDLPEHHESLAHHDLHEPHEAPGQSEAPMPPHLQFDHPPKRPRFSADPESLSPETDVEPPTGTHEPAPGAPAAPQHSAGDQSGVQETTEFDVEKHIAETRFQPDPETHARPRPSAPAEEAPVEETPVEETPVEETAAKDEDVLEETPEFLQDTPEHDRLWFEQRPPRDFDFDG